MKEKNKFLLVIGSVLAFMLVMSFWLAPTIFFENRNAGEEIARDSLSADNAVKEYRWFRAQWFDIKSHQDQLENHRQEEHRFHNETWPDGEWRDHRDARERHSRLHDRIVGQENMLESMIAEYNARQSDATRAIFQCGLPYNVDEKLFIADATGVEYTSQEAKNMKPPEDPSDCKFAGDPSNE